MGSAEDTTGSTDRLAEALGSPRRGVDGPYALVFSARGNELVRLPLEGDCVIGRDAQAAIRVADRSVSRRHARLTIAGPKTTLTDLGSENGTRLNGDRLKAPAEVASGDVIELGNTQIVFGWGAKRAPAATDRADPALTDALERALRAGRGFSVLLLDAARDVDRLAADVAAHAARGDVSGRAAAHAVAVVLGARSEDAARDGATRLLRALKPGVARTRGGLARFPDDGTDPSTLLAAARAACDRARPGALATVDDATARLAVGAREFLFADPAMIRAAELATRLAASDLPVLVHGETGVGKDVFALLVHHRSSRASGPFVALNCAALNDALLESELFGHRRGAFTGADKDRTGHVESAHGGTLFLDEVAELSPAAQAKLLRVLEEKRVVPLGDSAAREADVRIVGATHRDLQAEVAAGRFRSDLYFRIAAAPLFLPPLRDRPRDVTLLARTFLRRIATRAQKGPRAIAPSAMRALVAYGWPGNVRELENVVGHAAALAERDVLDATSLPGPVRDADPTSVVARDAAASPRPACSLDDELRELEVRRIREALTRCDGVQTRAARDLRMPLRTFQTKVKQYGLQKLGRARGDQ